MRRRQIFAQRAMDAAQSLKEFFTGNEPEVLLGEPDDSLDVTYTCECGKSFPTLQGLKIHKGRAHK